MQSDNMANVVVILDVNISDQERIEEIKKVIKEKLAVSDMREEEIGFGIKRLKIAVMANDEEGSNIEDVLLSIDGISSVETVTVTRV
jgi:translation elongation factor EF-1beta